MAVCDYCGEAYRGGAISDGPYRYCTGDCHTKGKALLRLLDQVPNSEIEQIVLGVHAGPCQDCGGGRSVDVYRSYRIVSALVYSTWRTNSYVTCPHCARKRQRQDLALCAVAGWWSPPGMLMTPFYIVFNVLELLRRKDKGRPSDELYKRVRMGLARKVAAETDRTQ